MRTIADKLADRFFTRDPFALAVALDRVVFSVPLDGMRGFYQRYKRNHFIYVDSRLEGFQRQFVCAHELGHSLLHGGMNTVFLDSRTHFVHKKYETEADRFAIDLLLPADSFVDYRNMGVMDIANSLELPEDLIIYRLNQLD